jgi:hypothetical protein
LAEYIASLADEVYHIDKLGHFSRIPASGLAKPLDSLNSTEGKALDHSEAEPFEAADSRVLPSAERPTQPSAKLQAPLISMERQSTKQALGDREVYKTYFKSVGLIHTTIFLVVAMAWAVIFKLPGKRSWRVVKPLS